VPGSLTFLTPIAGLLALLVLVPLAALLLARTRVQRARTVLALAAPAHTRERWRSAALVSVPLLLALALMQPTVRQGSSHSVRVDAAVFVVVDTSSSMSAAAGPRAPSRLTQAKRVALALGSKLGDIPVGVATFTDRVLPNLFPTGDRAAFDSTIQSLAIASPPPRETSRVATSFAALGALARSDYFTSAEKHRAVLLISDGESRPLDASSLARVLAAGSPVHVVVVRVGVGGDRFYANGRPAGRYRADPEGARQAISQLVSSTGGNAFSSASTGAAAALRSALGSGPTRTTTSETTSRGLAPLIRLITLIPLLFVSKSSSASLRAERRSS
jgi:von Willebrand factor type A domain